jgi:glutamine synthetase
MYSREDVLAYIKEENVKFIRLAFCDIYGKQKNVAIMPEEIERAFEDGISFDASAIDGFESEVRSDMFLHPDPSTLAVLPWRPSNGRVIRMFCDVCYPDGTHYQKDGREILRRAIARAEELSVRCNFGAEYEFYLFQCDESGSPTRIPYDRAGYMAVAPEDKGENIRREICLTLQDMGIRPESSHHEVGPGQNEIDFRYSDPMTAANHAVTFRSVVETIAMRNGLYADFSPKPLTGCSGNGMHINFSVTHSSGKDVSNAFMAGILKHVREITYFLNPTENSYLRLGEMKAPRYVTWSHENRSQLIRIPAAKGAYRRIELRSPDPCANPYVAYALMIHAGIDGIIHNMKAPEPTNVNLYTAPTEITSALEKLPSSLEEARKLACESEFLKEILPEGYLDSLS